MTYLNHAQGGQLLYRMPFDPLFWRKAERGDAPNSWTVSAEAKTGMAPVTAPDEVQGFIVSLPTNWTGRENNLSIKTHIISIADRGNAPGNPFDANAATHQTVVGSAGESKEPVA